MTDQIPTDTLGLRGADAAMRRAADDARRIDAQTNPIGDMERWPRRQDPRHRRGRRRHAPAISCASMNMCEGWNRLDAGCLEGEEDVEPRDYRLPTPDDKAIAEVIYGGFTTCVYPRQKFHSDPERKLAVVCERDTSVLKWMKPFRVQFPIHLRNGRNYEPDFVIETDTAKLLVEVKRRVDLETAKVIENKNAAAIWCSYATQHATAKGLKPWHYLLIPHDEVKEATDMAGYVAEFTIWE